MYKFSDFAINTNTITNSLIGDKIRTEKILNREITIEAFKIGPSKFEGKGDRLDIQIAINGNRHVVFTSGKALIEAIQQVPKDKFPFVATIIKENDYLKFT